MCGPRTRPLTNVDPPRVELPSAGSISSRRPRGDNLYSSILENSILLILPTKTKNGHLYRISHNAGSFRAQSRFGTGFPAWRNTTELLLSCCPARFSLMLVTRSRRRRRLVTSQVLMMVTCQQQRTSARKELNLIC